VCRLALSVAPLSGLLLAGVALAVDTPSATRPAAVLSPTTWQAAALWGADVRSLAVDPRSPDVVLAGTSAGHVYRSTDGGSSWQEGAPSLPLRGYVVGTLVFDPNRPARLWAGLWGIWGGGSVAWSEDLGSSWHFRGAGLEQEQVYTLAVVPGAPGRLYAASRAGVWGSEDDGASWRLLTTGYPEVVNVSSLRVDPYRPASLLAGTWRRAFRSEDGGRTWAGVFDGMILDTEVFSLTPDVRHPGEVWASTCGWVYQSTNWGRTWRRFQNGLAERRTPSFGVTLDGRLFAGTVAGLYSSDDQGASWQRRTSPELAVLAIATHPGRPQRVWIGTEGAGVYVSDDRGASFRQASLGLTNTRVSALVSAGGELLAAVPHAGPDSGIYRSRDGGVTFAPTPEPLPTVLDLAVADGELWAATEQGLFVAGAGRPWQRVGELGSVRVEQVVAGDRRVVARLAGGLAERLPGHGLFTTVPYRHGTPRSLALVDHALWVADADGLYRLAEGENHTVTAPFRGGRLGLLGFGLLYSGDQGVWLRDTLAAPWQQLHDRPGRTLQTGDQRFPVVVVEAGSQPSRVLLWDTAGGRFRDLEAPITGRDVLAARVVGDSAPRVLLGTSGYGLIGRPLD
jgi:photosystem II stability/assembly factor-like uncharacterized protein